LLAGTSGKAEVIDHAISYVEGAVHTNGIENFWSLLKRTIKGTYVSVEPFHLGRYLDEQAWRFNEREHNDGTRFRKGGIVCSWTAIDLCGVDREATRRTGRRTTKTRRSSPRKRREAETSSR
jgi:hypothetical protein